eukprot:scaffold42456_cov66-Phaeocystis_antarctica.AAC.1
MAHSAPWCVSPHAGQANAGRSAAEKPGTSPAAKPAEPMRVEESTDGVDPLGFGNVSPKSPGELQKTFGSENEGHGATPGSGTGLGEGMGENQAAQSGRDGGLGEKSGGGAGSAVTSTAQMEMETASEDSARTVVLNAPRALVCEDNDFLRGARSHYVRSTGRGG